MKHSGEKLLVLFLYRTCTHCLLTIMEMHICRKKTFLTVRLSKRNGKEYLFILSSGSFLWAMASECLVEDNVFQISHYLHWTLVGFALLQNKINKKHC